MQKEARSDALRVRPRNRTHQHNASGILRELRAHRIVHRDPKKDRERLNRQNDNPGVFLRKHVSPVGAESYLPKHALPVGRIIRKS